MKTTRHPLRPLLCLALLTALVAAPWAVAQPPGAGDGPGFDAGHRGHRGHDRLHDLRFLARFLELTDEQIEQARTLHETARDQTQPIREDLRANRGVLRELLDAEAPDPVQVGRLVLDSHDLRGQLRDTRETLFEDFQAILTPEQLEKLETFRDAREARREQRKARRMRGDRPGA